MKYNPKIHRRQSIRLKGYDYSQNGAYFITICTQNRECIFGKIKNRKMFMNDVGEIIKNEWEQLPERFPNIEFDIFVIMPNHFHVILIIQNETVGVPLVGTQSIVKTDPGQPQGIAPTMGDMIGSFKSLTTNQYIRGVKSKKFPQFEKRIWQRNYHEHIIRNETSFEKIQNYVIHNPEKWEDDTFFIQ